MSKESTLRVDGGTAATEIEGGRNGALWAAVALALAVVPLVIDRKAGSAGLLAAGLWVVLIALGAMGFASAQAVGGARWWLPFSGNAMVVAEVLFVALAAVAVAIGVGLHDIYPWAGAAAHEPTVVAKAAWLNPTAFGIRGVVIALAWMGAFVILRRALRRPDAAGRARGGVAFILIGAVTGSVAMWDWGMSLEPTWASTMYAWYNFGAALQGGVAAIVLYTLWTSRPGDAARHDMGKYLFAFSMFWAYLWFSQFILTWYANMPEEVTHYEKRMFGVWAPLFWMNFVVTFVIPFLTLLPVKTKLSRPILMQTALIVLVGRALDSYVLVGPTQGDPQLQFALPAYGALAIGALLWLRMAHRNAVARRRRLT